MSSPGDRLLAAGGGSPPELQGAGGLVLGERGGGQAEGPFSLPVGELVRPGLPVRDHAEPYQQ